MLRALLYSAHFFHKIIQVMKCIRDGKLPHFLGSGTNTGSSKIYFRFPVSCTKNLVPIFGKAHCILIKLINESIVAKRHNFAQRRLPSQRFRWHEHRSLKSVSNSLIPPSEYIGRQLWIAANNMLKMKDA